MDVVKRKAKESQFEQLKEVHHRAYRDVVVEQFGQWDERLQDQFFTDKWNPEEIQVVSIDGEDCGFLIVKEKAEELFLSEVIIDPRFQGKGLGTTLVKSEMARASALKLPLRLQVLVKNKAVNLYSRLGFRQYDETDTHLLMEWQA